MTASSSKNADLLAAMRGGGTLFGVVTEVIFKAYDISDYHGGVITYEDDTNCTALRLGRHPVQATCELSRLRAHVTIASCNIDEHAYMPAPFLEGSDKFDKLKLHESHSHSHSCSRSHSRSHSFISS